MPQQVKGSGVRGQGPGARGQRSATARCGAGMVLAGLALLVLARALLADGGVFATTPHGSPTTGLQRLTGPDYPRGSCVQCHYQHASVEGSATGAPNPYALFAPNDNNLCGSPGCHDGAGADHIYQGLSDYTVSVHATDGSAVWPGPTPWARRTGDAGKCVNCHDPHGYTDSGGLLPTLGLAREEKLCLACHDGSPAHTNISYELTKTYSHPVTPTSGRHSAAEGGDATRFGSGNRHAECEDCHNVHQTRHPAFPPAAPAASDRLRGVSYVSVSNGPAWTQPAYLFHAADDPTPIQYEYQLCFKCHSSWTTLPLTSPSGRAPTDKAKEFNPNNLSYHPMEAAGKQTAATWPANSLLPPYTTASILYCSDCHASDSPAAPAGPHGSNNRFLLEANYAVVEHSPSYQSSDFALCFRCHQEAALLNDQDTGTNDTHFRFHRKHLQDAPGNQPNLPLCASCHGNSHGSTRPRLIDFTREPHLTSFTSWTSKEAGAGTGQCTLTCHGEAHAGRTY